MAKFFTLHFVHFLFLSVVPVEFKWAEIFHFLFQLITGHSVLFLHNNKVFSQVILPIFIFKIF